MASKGLQDLKQQVEGAAQEAGEDGPLSRAHTGASGWTQDGSGGQKLEVCAAPKLAGGSGWKGPLLRCRDLAGCPPRPATSRGMMP